MNFSKPKYLIYSKCLNLAICKVSFLKSGTSLTDKKYYLAMIFIIRNKTQARQKMRKIMLNNHIIYNLLLTR